MTRTIGVVFIVFSLLASSCKEKPAEQPTQEAKPAEQPAQEVKPLPPPFRVVYTGMNDTDRIKNIILRYNDLLAWGYANLNMSYLEEVTTKFLAEDAYIHMAAIGEGKVKMLSQLKKIEFTDLAFQGKDKVVVKTEEHWDYSYTDINTGELKDEEKDFVYLVTYTIEKDGDRWVIMEVEASVPDKPKPKVSEKSGSGEQKNTHR